MTKITACLAVIALGASTPAIAYESHEVRNPAGQAVFEVRFYNPEDGRFHDEYRPPSSWAWESHIKEQVLHGIGYWAEVLQLPPGQGPAVLNIGTNDMQGNAYGASPLGDGYTDHRTLLQRHFQGLPVDPEDTFVNGGMGVFALGPSVFAPEYWFSQIPLTGYDDLVSTSIHEVAHGLGASTWTTHDDDKETKPRFGPVLAKWMPLMLDDHGRPARPGQAILCDVCENPYDPDAFDARADRVVLAGPHIDDVLEGAFRGVPVSMYGYAGDERVLDNNDMSHTELKNSMMSHQNYRNYTGFMEAELAVLQDLGYTIDRRNFFGRSVYGSGLDIVNDRPFYARNAQGTDYRFGENNKAVLGLGLHVYGSHNRIRQTADLLASGEGGAGIRVDGEGNAIVIDPGVRVHANGVGGQGVMFTYGRHHTLVQRGDVEAQGPHGVGLRFDFGNNALENKVEYRGSYIHTIRGKPWGPAPELQGPLVSRADITGRVAGNEAAIFMGATGYVGNLNIMQGARIEGDIVSHYAQRDEAGARRITQVSFGQRADEQGRSTGAADPGFRMAYGGNIRGPENIALTFEGGQTVLSGDHRVVDVTVRPEATLGGATSFELADDGLFLNEGRLAPGASIGTMTIDGDFRQTSTGRLHIEVTPSGEHDVLAVSGTVDLAGALEVAPAEGWYGSSWSLDSRNIIAGAPQAVAFDTLAVDVASPTLGFAARPAVGREGFMLTTARAADAYSRHGTNDNARAAGRALEASLDALPAAMQPFMVAMDFSAPDGSGVARALDLASPQGYSAGLAASLLRERDVMETALRGFGDGLRNAQGSEWKGFAVAFGSDGRQDNRDSMIGYDATTYGLVIGGGRMLASNPDIAVGVHLDVAEQRVKLDSPQWGKGDTTAFGLGAQLQYQPNPMAGAHAHAGFRLGIEHGSMDRKVAVGSYYASHSSDWTGHSASVQAGGGYRFPLSSTLSVGPIATLNYARVSRPGVDESGPEATRLALDSRNIDALRSSLGVAAVMRHTLENGSTLRAHAEASWDHEWLDRDVVQTARFAAVSGPTFQSRNAVMPRNSLGLRAGLQWQRNDRFSVGAGLGGRLGNGYKSLEGQVSLRWAF